MYDPVIASWDPRVHRSIVVDQLRNRFVVGLWEFNYQVVSTCANSRCEGLQIKCIGDTSVVDAGGWGGRSWGDRRARIVYVADCVVVVDWTVEEAPRGAWRIVRLNYMMHRCVVIPEDRRSHYRVNLKLVGGPRRDWSVYHDAGVAINNRTCWESTGQACVGKSYSTETTRLEAICQSWAEILTIDWPCLVVGIPQWEHNLERCCTSLGYKVNFYECLFPTISNKRTSRKGRKVGLDNNNIDYTRQPTKCRQRKRMSPWCNKGYSSIIVKSGDDKFGVWAKRWADLRNSNLSWAEAALKGNCSG